MDRRLCGVMDFATVGKLAQAGDKDNRGGGGGGGFKKKPYKSKA